MTDGPRVLGAHVRWPERHDERPPAVAITIIRTPAAKRVEFLYVEPDEAIALASSLLAAAIEAKKRRAVDLMD